MPIVLSLHCCFREDSLHNVRDRPDLLLFVFASDEL